MKREYGKFYIAGWKKKKKFMVCASCGRNDGKGDKMLTRDHIIPVAEGGSNTIDNIQILCLGCHKKKDNAVKKEARAI